MRPTHTASASIVIQPRDIELLRGLFESRVMTIAHISALYFDGRPEAAKKRLQRLKSARLVALRPRETFETAVLFLTRQGLALLHERGILREYPPFDLAALEKRAVVSEATLRHELEVMDVKASLCAAARKTANLSMIAFITFPLLIQFEAAGAQVKPDGFMRIWETRADGVSIEHAFFLEIDRSSEALATLGVKATRYLAYYKSGGFAKRRGAARAAYRAHPFRVLMVFETAERRNNVAERLLQGSPPVFTQAWLSTLADLTENPLGSIWVRPVDYRKATKGTAFDTERRAGQRGYQRQTAREVFVERNVKKQRLLADEAGK